MNQPFIKTGEQEKGIERYAVDKLIDFMRYTRFDENIGFECFYDTKNNFAICGNQSEIIAWIHGDINKFRKLVNRDAKFFEQVKQTAELLTNILTAVVSSL
ncbi:MAG: hypothetical protein ACP5G1_04005 [Nanopusillaceae archaeon]